MPLLTLDFRLQVSRQFFPRIHIDEIIRDETAGIWVFDVTFPYLFQLKIVQRVSSKDAAINGSSFDAIYISGAGRYTGEAPRALR